LSAEITHIEGVRDFLPWRAEVDHARSGAQLLDALISPRNARALIRTLPSEDLHGMIRRIGLSDSTELLALASGEQVRDILDTEIWIRDELSIERADAWMGALMHAGHDVLVQRVMALDDEVINWVVRRTVRVVVVEEPDDFVPEDIEHVVTPDNRLCIYFPESAPRDLPVKLLLDGLMQSDPVYCVDLLIHAQAALDSNLQEQAYRWRRGRMADRGYVDYYEALTIYTPPARQPGAAGPKEIDRDPPRRWLAPVVDPEARLAAALARLDDIEPVQASLGYVANMALSADRVEPWDLDAQAAVLRRLRAGLVLGLDSLAGPDADVETDARVLADVPVATIFRTGYGRMVEAASPIRRVRPALRIGPDPIGAVDLPALRPWAEALTGRHPTRPDGEPLADAADLQKARAVADTVAALVRVAVERPPERGLGAWLVTWLARDLLGIEGPGPLPADRLTDAHTALFADGALRPETAAAAESWWSRAGGDDAPGSKALTDAAVESMAAVAACDLEPRFLPLLWIG